VAEEEEIMIMTVCGKLEAKLMKRDEARDVTRFIGRSRQSIG